MIALSIMVTDAEPVFPKLSVTVIVVVPSVLSAVKVPVVNPIEPRRVLLTAQKSGAVPPVAVKVCLPPFGNCAIAGLTTSWTWTLITVTEAVPVFPDASTTEMVAEPVVLEAVKMPVAIPMEPTVESLIDQVNGALPLAVNVCVPFFGTLMVTGDTVSVCGLITVTEAEPVAPLLSVTKTVDVPVVLAALKIPVVVPMEPIVALLKFQKKGATPVAVNV